MPRATHAGDSKQLLQWLPAGVSCYDHDWGANVVQAVSKALTVCTGLAEVTVTARHLQQLRYIQGLQLMQHYTCHAAGLRDRRTKHTCAGTAVQTADTARDATCCCRELSTHRKNRIRQGDREYASTHHHTKKIFKGFKMASKTRRSSGGRAGPKQHIYTGWTAVALRRR
jgi:hypothetical protein